MATKKQPAVAYTAISIAPVKDREFTIIELDMSRDNDVLAVRVSEPLPFHIAVYRQKQRSAELWTGAAL